MSDPWLLIEIDAGNTRVKWRCRALDRSGHWLTADEQYVVPDEWPDKAGAVWVSNVAGDEVGVKLIELVKSHSGIEPLFARTEKVTGLLVNSYLDPSHMGVDRWLAMLAGFGKSNRACCVIDCGSAVTVDLVSVNGRHQGGYIMPGRRLLFESLSLNTAQVNSAAQLAGGSVRPGTNTGACVAAGVELIVKGISEALADNLGSLGSAVDVWLTGGDSDVFEPYLASQFPSLRVEPNLVLDGLEFSFASQ